MKKRNIIFGYIAGIVLIIFLVIAYMSNVKDQGLLKTEGHRVNGVITKVVDRKRGLDFKYQFMVKGSIYESWEKTYKEVSFGDTIEIIYYYKDPSISKPAFEMK